MYRHHRRPFRGADAAHGLRTDLAAVLERPSPGRRSPKWLLFPLVLVACGGDAAGVEPREVASVELDVRSGRLANGQRYKLSVTTKDTSGTPVDGTETVFSVSDSTVLAVGADSTVTALSPGTADVMVVVDGKSATASFEVVRFTAVAAGELYTCAITGEAELYCAGERDTGAERMAPELHFSQVSVGHSVACAVTIDGAAYCWGANRSGQLGTGDRTARFQPAPVAGGLRFVSIATELEHSCGITQGGEAYCWGSNSWGQLGNRAVADTSLPVLVSGGMHFTAITTGFYSTCALTSAGEAYCWGRHELGELGVGTPRGPGDKRSVPTPVAGGFTYTEISAATNHACALTPEGKVHCWGNNRVGSVGTTTSEVCAYDHKCSGVPVAISSGREFSAVDASGYAGCALETNGRLWCWGLDLGGKLGPHAPDACPVSGTREGCTTQPVLAAENFVSVSGGWSHQCGFRPDGIAYCWGSGGTGATAPLGSATTPFAFGIDPTAQ